MLRIATSGWVGVRIASANVSVQRATPASSSLVSDGNCGRLRRIRIACPLSSVTALTSAMIAPPLLRIGSTSIGFAVNRTPATPHRPDETGPRAWRRQRKTSGSNRRCCAWRRPRHRRRRLAEGGAVSAGGAAAAGVSFGFCGGSATATGAGFACSAFGASVASALQAARQSGASAVRRPSARSGLISILASLADVSRGRRHDLAGLPRWRRRLGQRAGHAGMAAAGARPAPPRPGGTPRRRPSATALAAAAFAGACEASAAAAAAPGVSPAAGRRRR